MAEKFKSQEEITHLASALRARRTALGLTLQEAEQRVHVNCGQLSRFEKGNFKTNSSNLQKYARFLQLSGRELSRDEPSLGDRLEQFAARSPAHRKAAEELLSALERLS